MRSQNNIKKIGPMYAIPEHSLSKYATQIIIRHTYKTYDLIQLLLAIIHRDMIMHFGISMLKQ